MSKYREALNNLRKTAMNLTDLKHHSFPTQLMYRLDDNSKLIQELVDKHEELESRKDKLVVGSEWVCVANCYGNSWAWISGSVVKVVKIDSHVFIESFVNDNVPKDQFLLCFAPKEKTE